MAKPQLLLVDADPRQLRLLEVSLKSEGFNVTVASDGMDAWSKLGIAVPDILVTSTRLPRVDGYELVKRLKDHRETRGLPIIFLASDSQQEGRIRALELGVEDYMPRPVLARELVARAHVLLAKRVQLDLTNAAQGVLGRYACSLSEVGLVDLLQLIDEGRPSGVAHVTSGSRELVMYFHQGRVVDAVNGQLRGEEAIYRALLWSEGQFELETREIQAEETITTSTQGLLMEGVRRLDEMGRVVEQLPSMEAVFSVVPDVLRERLGEMPDDLNGLLRQIDGIATIETLMDTSPFDDLSTLTILCKLYFDGMLKQVGGHVAKPVQPDVRAAVIGLSERSSVTPRSTANLGGNETRLIGSGSEPPESYGQPRISDVPARASFRPSAPPMTPLMGTIPGLGRADSLSSALAESTALAFSAGAPSASSMSNGAPLSRPPVQVPGLKRTDPGIVAVSVAPTVALEGDPRSRRAEPARDPNVADSPRWTSEVAPAPVRRDTLRPGSVRNVDPQQPSYAFEEKWRVGPDAEPPQESRGREAFATLIHGTPLFNGVRERSEETEAVQFVSREPEPVAVSKRPEREPREGNTALVASAAASDLDADADWDAAWRAGEQNSEAEPAPIPVRRPGVLPWLLAGVALLAVLAIWLTRAGDTPSSPESAAAQAPAQGNARAPEFNPPPPPVQMAPEAVPTPEPSEDVSATSSLPTTSINPKPTPPKPPAAAVHRAPPVNLTPKAPRSVLPDPRDSSDKKRPPTARFPAPTN